VLLLYKVGAFWQLVLQQEGYLACNKLLQQSTNLRAGLDLISENKAGKTETEISSKSLKVDKEMKLELTATQ